MANEIDIHDSFRKWVIKHGVTINPAITARNLPGKGFGMVSVKPVKADEVLIKLPVETLITIDSTFAQDSRIPSNITVHSALATAWTLNAASHEDRKLQEWEATWPSRADLESYSPLFWPPASQDRLTPAGKVYLADVQRKIAKDWAEIKSTITAAGQSEADYRYYWMMVNTRCFFWKFAKAHTADSPPSSVDECMALCPYADYFNHASSGCTFRAEPTYCAIVADRDYPADVEINISYGTHNNDMLLVEYGFLLQNNLHDHIKLDALLLPKFNEKQRTLLTELGYLGDYALDRVEVCFRTRIAMAVLLLPARFAQRYAETGELSKSRRVVLADGMADLLQELQDEINAALKEIKRAKDGSLAADMVKRRWEEWKRIVDTTEAWDASDSDDEG
ncbi:SET domain-containing protein [Microthyrium microscopicum]|uniref:SET domain-containing protein n=1 Tax=Microthyrium microscopicum TaxID=703497 RepID=A0A6A6TY79_9PEZI|nr:SET domain-containing protein [Microthyrium microscopicum]